MFNKFKKTSEKQGNESVKSEKSTEKKSYNVIIGICMFLTVLSIAYSSWIIITGIDSLIPKIFIAPQALFAIVYSYIQFIK